MRSLLALGVACVPVWAIACSTSTLDCTINSTCTAFGADGGALSDASDGGPVIVPAGCDLAKPARESPACLSDDLAVFVSAAGDDSAAGTKNAPVRSIAKGVDLAGTKQRPRIYVCSGVYDQAVEVHTPLSILGGLSCDWQYTADAKVALAPAKGIALRITSVMGQVRIEDIQITGSADTSVPGDSAIAAFVAESSDVTFDHVSLTAGPGVAGSVGETRSNYAAAASVGGNATGITGGIGPTCTCADDSSSTGGNGASGSGSGISNGSSKPPVGMANSGLTGASTCAAGNAGANGLANPPLEAPVSWGLLTKDGIQFSKGPTTAANGYPGQGGGGGGGQSDNTFAGGAGGCGGCGGAGGLGAGGGGASIGLVSFNAAVKVNTSVVVTGPAGAGGRGGKGQDGQAGAQGGTGICKGGAGGSGAGGTGGPGGVGGPSAGIAYVGQTPQTFSTTFTIGAKGLGGDGGEPGAGPGNAGAVGNRGVDGTAKEILQL